MRSVVILLILAILAACSRAGQPLDHREPGSVRFDLAADPATLNPLFAHQDASSVELQVGRLAFEPFVDIDERGRAQPALLSRIPSQENGDLSADGRTITYRLRQNVKWQDGVPVTSTDVLFTLRAIMDKRNPVRSLEGYELIDRARAPDPRTVIFHLRKPWAPAVRTLFSYGATSQFVLPQHVLQNQRPLAQGAFNAAPVGDGPYKLVSWSRGEKLVYERNPLYWRGAARMARLDIRIVPDPSINLTLLASGEVDWNLIAPLQQRLLAANPDIAYREVPTATIAGVAINLRHAPLNDARLRRAIAMSIDRQSISKRITLGKYPVANSAQPSFSFAYDPTVRLPQFSPSAADAIFDSAGWKRGPDGIREKNGTPLQLTYVQFTETASGMHSAELIERNLRDRGIDVQIKKISSAQLFLPRTGALAGGAYDLAYVPWPMGADPDDSAVLSCGGASNYMRYCDPQVERWEQAAQAAASQSQRRVLYSKIGHAVARDVPIIYLFEAHYIYAYRKELRDFYPNAFLPTWDAWRWHLR